MIVLPAGHLAGIPVEEALASFAPVVFLVSAVAFARLGARLHGLRHRARRRTTDCV